MSWSVSDGETGGYVGFEWIGKEDYLNEANAKGQRSRGAHATAADAVVRFEQDGCTETLLIEWKYTESYGAGLATSATSTETRLNRYEKIVFAPKGPIRADLGLALEDFFYEPFYQLLRQQMLAHQMQMRREDGAERVRVLHIAPLANRKLRRVTSPAIRQKIGGDNAFSVFRSLLANPDDFISAATESLFSPLLQEPGEAAEWADYLTSRYAFLAADMRMNIDFPAGPSGRCSTMTIWRSGGGDTPPNNAITLFFQRSWPSARRSVDTPTDTPNDTPSPAHRATENLKLRKLFPGLRSCVASRGAAHKIGGERAKSSNAGSLRPSAGPP
ncbi:hypothetical protein VQ042_21360 [Aurantimonas sp. A2-1-M11]|uniref:PGN_0703 family putative restriction endonuclease n=1 Tax=Aurantimonas sp. A2-1-M11 TaxID=3113712 RepID=UPI002F95BC95